MPCKSRPYRFHNEARLFANKHLAVHPTVTLSISDHHTRVAKSTNKRVIGILLGEFIDGKTHTTNSFAVPFEEDMKDSSIWYLDHHYLESMAYMFGKISKKEKIVGWYSTGSQIKPADLEIHELVNRYCHQPMYLLVNVQQTTNLSTDHVGELPFKTYMAYDEPSNDNLFKRSFAHIASGVAQFEAEEVGVEHLLRHLESLSTSTRSTKILDKLNGLKCLQERLLDIAEYLQDVASGKLPTNARILTNLQNLLNLSPDTSKMDLIESFDVETNNCMLTIYIGSVVRTVLALHDLVKNRLELKAKTENKPKGKTPDTTTTKQIK